MKTYPILEIRALKEDKTLKRMSIS